MSSSAVWLVAGLLLGAQELIAPGFFLLWIGLAACGTGLLAFGIGVGWHGQLASFAALAIALIGFAAWRRRPVPDTTNAPAAGLIGGQCTALAFRAGEGRVSFRDGQWQARTTVVPDPQAGDLLRVVGLDGTTLLVAPSP